MFKIAALWQAKTNKGESFLSGKFGDARLLVFKNNKKTNEKAPDYIVYVAEDTSWKKGGGGGGGGSATPPEDEVPF